MLDSSTRAFALLIGLWMCGCEGGPPAPTTASATAQAGAEMAPSAAAGSAASASSSASAVEKPSAGQGSWTATFQVEAGEVESIPIYPAWKKPGEDGLGEATLRIEVAADGSVDGTLEGALGALVASGELDDAGLRLALAPKPIEAGAEVPEEGAAAMRGVIFGALGDDGGIRAELRASSQTGDVARKATLELKRE